MDVFIIGSKGIPANYGGFETFVDQLTKQKVNKKIQYHVSCLADNNNDFFYNDAHCFNVDVKDIGSAKAILYDVYSIKRCIEYIKKNKLKHSIVYVLACRIGPFISHYRRILHKLGAKLFVNPDGHEWKRSKWSRPVRLYWKISERLMVKNADLLVCDSKGIEDYILSTYKNYQPKTTFIAYGADVIQSSLQDNDEKLVAWQQKNHVHSKQYYLIVGRFVPENNYELMIKEFMSSNTNKDLVIISNVEKNTFFDELVQKTKFNQDKRIKFVGTVYDTALLKKIREEAYGYFHGHEVGGTNPSLLEALSSTSLNLLLNVVFNQEVGQESALYFNKAEGNLANLIDKADGFSSEEVQTLKIKAQKRILEFYSWNSIVNKYESLFTDD
ncbi:MAG: glycosyl transferase [Massilibacillus sp.]|jgi:rhamnosyltransferase|nr:glycosyl transferase [Massilibacillus sp.]